MEIKMTSFTENYLPIVEVESSETKVWREKIEGSSTAFSRSIDTLFQMSDKFGLCGLICYNIMGSITILKKWNSVKFDPQELKKQFDLYEKLPKLERERATTPALNFLRKNSNLFSRKLLVTKSFSGIKKLFDERKYNQQQPRIPKY